MPPDNRSVENRLTDVEEELHRLKRLLGAKLHEDDVPWWKKIIGTRENDSVFAEIVELGRKSRKQTSRAATKRKRGAKSGPTKNTVGQE